MLHMPCMIYYGKGYTEFNFFWGQGEHLPPLAWLCPPYNFFDSELIQVF